MAGNVTKPQLVIPTQYAQQQQSIAQKRKLAEAMLSQGLSNDPNMNNWAQVLGKLAQAWAGKSMDNEATKSEGLLNEQIRGDYDKSVGDFFAGAKSAPLAETVQAIARNPLLEGVGKPFQDAYATQLRERENLIKFGGRSGIRQGDVMGMADNDPNSMVHQGPNGETFLNEPRVAAAGIASGAYAPKEIPQTVGQMPGIQRLVGAMSGQPPAAADPELPPVQPEEGVIPGVAGIVNGQKYWVINGKYYDNPEGR